MRSVKALLTHFRAVHDRTTVILTIKYMVKKYKSIETWTKAMQKDKQKKLWHDWFNIDGHWYTCEEYDDSGKYMRYTSVTAWKHIDIETSNRYSQSWLSDMKATAYDIGDSGLRFDITYYLDDIKEVSKSTILNLNIRLYENKMYKEIRDLLDMYIYTFNK